MGRRERRAEDVLEPITSGAMVLVAASMAALVLALVAALALIAILVLPGANRPGPPMERARDGPRAGRPGAEDGSLAFLDVQGRAYVLVIPHAPVQRAPAAGPYAREWKPVFLVAGKVEAGNAEAEVENGKVMEKDYHARGAGAGGARPGAGNGRRGVVSWR